MSGQIKAEAPRKVALSQSAFLFDEDDGAVYWGLRDEPCSGNLLDISPARRWFSILEWGYRNDLYTFQKSLERKSGPVVQVSGKRFLMVSSYDYLGLIGHPEVENSSIEAIRRFGSGTGGVRLLTGTTDLHREFEEGLSAFKGTEAALTFASGYMANIGTISSLFGPRDLIVVDSRAHKSIIDGCRLARSQLLRFTHNALGSLEYILKKRSTGRRTLIVVEGVYSMDGDICPLPEIIALKKKYGAFLMVDEAHSFGVLGSTGEGVNSHFGIPPDDVDIWTGTLSKAVPAMGGFVAGSRRLITYLQHGAGPFVFSAALCPASLGAAKASLNIMRHEPKRLVRLHANADFLRKSLISLGYDTGKSCSPIVPLIIGNEEAAFRFARELFGKGIIATAIVSPAVPARQARLRLCATASMDEAFLNEVLDVFALLRKKAGEGAG